MLTLIEILQSVFAWLGLAILFVSPFLPRTSLAKRYIPDFHRREMLPLGGGFLGGLLICISISFSNIVVSLCMLGIITLAAILAVLVIRQ